MTHSRRNNDFFRDHYNKVITVLIVGFFLTLALVSFLVYQIYQRPLPRFIALSDTGQQMALNAFDEPNLLSTTLITWASKAAVAAYTYDFVNSDKQMAIARSYFTDAGWTVFQKSLIPLITSIKQNQLFVSGVVTGPPVISNQGELPGRGYVWRIQLPFLVTYQSSDATTRKKFTVTVTIVKVPTWKNPAGIGIDQFVM